jgi:hypothetical protein
VSDITDTTSTDFLSQKFACLPCDFLVSQDGTAKALSYINNLHPCYSALYRHFEELLSKCVPMFEHVLFDLYADNPTRERVLGGLEEQRNIVQVRGKTLQVIHDVYEICIV